MLYLIDDITGLDDGFAERAAPLLSAERRAKALAYRFPRDQTLSAAVYLLLRMALAEQSGIDAPPEFAYGENGKPFLKAHPHIHFSLSHCRRAAACAVSDAVVGVDVQAIAPVPDKLARRVLTPEEYAAYVASPRPDELFCEFWVRKESLLKQTGLGVATDLSKIPAGNTGWLFKGEGYYGCVTAPPAALRRVSAAELPGFAGA
ncbi:MAG: 4'-phosphopantetheinyl transferase superfamily protein [Oscillospiraceae bacterium]|nr:4'-phosphopantetheinyl transferase superfamily protein [Oscillospiraceae bacterium]